ncbi:uncharacterized protein KGF55_004607 [Candida pseudojiufengensis]|uniref:uncharacterized protein n=1 Tax=Candida pseudojiufengensis TaxID=497109 RepID=UPI00222485F6|nr:uncharacterized protein KGF55_004607 [Candida pseudojiufengensis]KAI5960315.1 hypothetical protein KGF55_004607 [Candida pseudojiufengensis]
MDKEQNNIKVLVRVRPLLSREIQDEIPQSLVSMPSNEQTYLQNPKTNESKSFYFDDCIWSFNRKDPHYTDNLQFYKQTGPDLLTHLFEGYNVCLLAYGQTSSGKTYTMMGDQTQPGIIPCLINDILKQMELSINQKIHCELKFSYMEIYNESVKDLLNPKNQTKCKIREHPQTGPYVENLKEITIKDYNHFLQLLNSGNLIRSTATTSMNDQSSRSHAIITLTLKQIKFENINDNDDGIDNESIGEASEEMISNIKLVDLAGSERLTKTKLFGQSDRIKEGSLINKSLTVLGRCIHLLSTKSKSIIPYRDSILTYILKENLSGNSKTCMLFCISPLDYEESLQTLNYANEVKKIKTIAKANKIKLSTIINWEELQKSDQSLIGSLKNEVEILTSKLSQLETNENVKSSSSTSISDSPNFTKIIEYLEKDSSKFKFENKYLKNQIINKNNHIIELNNHINYIEDEYQRLLLNYQILKNSKFQDSKLQLLNEIQLCNENFKIDLTEFDPKLF